MESALDDWMLADHFFLNIRSAKQLSAEVLVCCELLCIVMLDTTDAF